MPRLQSCSCWGSAGPWPRSVGSSMRVFPWRLVCCWPYTAIAGSAVIPVTHSAPPVNWWRRPPCWSGWRAPPGDNNRERPSPAIKPSYKRKDPLCKSQRKATALKRRSLIKRRSKNLQVKNFDIADQFPVSGLPADDVEQESLFRLTTQTVHSTFVAEKTTKKPCPPP